MAFPLAPTTGQYHTEAGLRYKWTGTSWDLLDTSSDNQVLITSTVDPVTGVDTAPHIGTIWRNTATGEAFRYETIPAPSSYVVDLSPATNSSTSGGPYSRQTINFPATIALGEYSVEFILNTGKSFIVQLKIFTGEAVGSTFTSGEALFGVPPVWSSPTQSFSNSSGSTINVPVNFNVGGTVFPAGLHTFLVEITNEVPVGDFPNFKSSTTNPYPQGSYAGAAIVDMQFAISGTLTDDSQEWNPVRESPDFQVGSATPISSSIGSSLKEGDIWINSTTGSIYYRNSANTWVPIKAFYNNAIQNLLTSTNTQGAIEELDAIFDIVGGGSRPVGTYAPSTNTADFFPSTAYTDGTLPAANTLTAPDFLVVTEESVGQAPAPTIQMYKGDYLLADPGTNTWVHYPFGSPPLSFLLLSDTPSAYTGQNGQVLRVNATETGLEYINPLATDFHSYYQGTAPGVFIDSDLWVNQTNLLESVATGGQWLYTAPVATSVSTPPSNPTSGALWYDKLGSTLYIYDTSTIPASWVAV